MDTNILVCDDEETVRELISVVLGMAGYHVSTAANGVEALQMIKDKIDHYQLVLTDHKMPRMDGLGLVRKMRENAFPGKIIVLSGSFDAADITAYKKLAVDVIMRKPFDFAEFRTAVSGLLSHQIPGVPLISVVNR